MVGALAGAAAAGVCGSAARLVAAGMIIDTSSASGSPMFSRHIHCGETAELEGLHRTATIWLVLFSAPVYLLLAVFSPVVLALLGDDFSAGAPVLTIMCLAALTTFLAGNIHSVLLMSGRSGLAALNKAIAVSVNLALIVLLVPMWGITGAAIAHCRLHPRCRAGGGGSAFRAPPGHHAAPGPGPFGARAPAAGLPAQC